MTTIDDAIWAEPRWSDDVDLYLGPRLPMQLIGAIVALAGLLALGITLAIGL